jgi:hypothetical protein
MVARPEQHLWSSWRRNGFGEADPLVTPHALFNALGPDIASRAEADRALFALGLDPETLAPQRGRLPGDENFRKRMSATLNRPTQPGTTKKTSVGVRRGRRAKPVLRMRLLTSFSIYSVFHEGMSKIRFKVSGSCSRLQ